MSLIMYRRMSGENWNGYIERWFLFGRIPLMTRVTYHHMTHATEARKEIVYSKKKSKCHHDYAIIGTGSGIWDFVIETDIICSKCGHHETIYVFSDRIKDVYKYLGKSHGFRINRASFLTESQFDALVSK